MTTNTRRAQQKQQTRRGTFLGIPATGNAMTMRSIDIWRVAGSKFVEHWDELNLLELIQQLGVIPARR